MQRGQEALYANLLDTFSCMGSRGEAFKTTSSSGKATQNSNGGYACVMLLDAVAAYGAREAACKESVSDQAAAYCGCITALVDMQLQKAEKKG